MNDDLQFLRDAYILAAEFSTDPSTQNGALIVDGNGEVVSEGANHFPLRVQNLPERWERPLKYKYVEHAERNAVYLAAYNGVKCRDLTMYAAWAACADCARAIIQSGIRRVVTHHDPVAPTRLGQPASPTWIEEIKHALAMLKESGVQFDVYEDKLFDESFTVLFNGKKVSP